MGPASDIGIYTMIYIVFSWVEWDRSTFKGWFTELEKAKEFARNTFCTNEHDGVYILYSKEGSFSFSSHPAIIWEVDNRGERDYKLV
jgi:hypothetical protein